MNDTSDKTVSMAEAVGHVMDGQTLALGGMTIYRRPVAFAVALARRPSRPQDLTLLAFTGGFASDILVGSCMVTKTRCCYFGFEIFGLAPNFTAAASDGRLQVIEESEASIANGLRAAMGGVGFMPSRAWQGTDLFLARPDVQSIIDPYTGEQVTAFPAISCDVAVIHVPKADKLGNAILGGNPTIDLELATIADIVILTAEEIVDQIHDDIEVFGQMVTYVVHAPAGAWPTSCYPLYPIDGEEILNYISACNQGELQTYLDSFHTRRQ